MMQIIKGVLSHEVLREFQTVLANSKFVDGKATAGKVAGKIKNNLELDPKSPNRELLNNAAMGAIMSREEFQYGVMPSRVSTPIFARYQSGMTYGYHVDDPIMGHGGDRQYRSDVSLTLSLNNASDYEGGELAIKTSFGVSTIKPDAGDMVVYPSSSLHEVTPVTRGERLVMITWVQSMVSDPRKREILFSLWQARNNLLGVDNGEFCETSDMVDMSYVNLVRMWSNP